MDLSSYDAEEKKKEIDISAQKLSSNQASFIQITRKYVQNV